MDRVTGLIPAYHVRDWIFNWQITKQYALSAGINNFTNEHYFNRRITMTPDREFYLLTEEHFI